MRRQSPARPRGGGEIRPAASLDFVGWQGRDERGQGTVEWVGLVAVVALLLVGLLAAGVRMPGAGLAQAVASKLLCAAALAESCGDEPVLIAAYGTEVGGLVREHMPSIAFERGSRALPVDFRRCRMSACGDGSARGLVDRTDRGSARDRLRPRHRLPPKCARKRSRTRSRGRVGRRTGGHAIDCSGERAGHLYIQYWLYYADSATLRGVPIAGPAGYHRDDWESVQVRIGTDGDVDQRASSHHGYNHAAASPTVGSDAAIGLARGTSPRRSVPDPGTVGGRRPAWPAAVSGGSHAGNASGFLGDRSHHARRPRPSRPTGAGGETRKATTALRSARPGASGHGGTPRRQAPTERTDMSAAYRGFPTSRSDLARVFVIAPEVTAPSAPRKRSRTGLRRRGGARFELIEPLDDAQLNRVYSPMLSPLAWDLGHIANFEELWLVQTIGEREPLRGDLGRFYDAIENPRKTRGELPILRDAELRAYLADVRERTLEVLGKVEIDAEAEDPLLREGFVYEMLIAHEQQHNETMLQLLIWSTATVAQRRGWSRGSRHRSERRVAGRARACGESPRPEMIAVDGGAYAIGASPIGFAYDNERPRHQVELAPFEIDRTPGRQRRLHALSGGDGRRAAALLGARRRRLGPHRDGPARPSRPQPTGHPHLLARGGRLRPLGRQAAAHRARVGGRSPRPGEELAGSGSGRPRTSSPIPASRRSPTPSTRRSSSAASTRCCGAARGRRTPT